jgi:hypothetical protein
LSRFVDSLSGRPCPYARRYRSFYGQCAHSRQDLLQDFRETRANSAALFHLVDNSQAKPFHAVAVTLTFGKEFILR